MAAYRDDPSRLSGRLSMQPVSPYITETRHDTAYNPTDPTWQPTEMTPVGCPGVFRCNPLAHTSQKHDTTRHDTTLYTKLNTNY